MTIFEGGLQKNGHNHEKWLIQTERKCITQMQHDGYKTETLLQEVCLNHSSVVNFMLIYALFHRKRWI